MQVRLAFSMAIRAEADILLVDEVLAVGDADFQRKCFDYFRSLKKNKKTVVFVSHDMNAIREYCDRAALIEKNELILEGKSSKIATAYTRMFIEQDNQTKDNTKPATKRWGDGFASYENVSISHGKLTNNDKALKITATAKIKQDINNPVFGFSIKSASDAALLGTNSQIKQHEISKLKSGDSVSIVWQVPNIFNEGKYYIDLAITHHDGSAIAEWWEEAATFEAVLEEKTPYIIAPPIMLELAIN